MQSLFKNSSESLTISLLFIIYKFSVYVCELVVSVYPSICLHRCVRVHVKMQVWYVLVVY